MRSNSVILPIIKVTQFGSYLMSTRCETLYSFFTSFTYFLLDHIQIFKSEITLLPSKVLFFAKYNYNNSKQKKLHMHKYSTVLCCCCDYFFHFKLSLSCKNYSFEKIFTFYERNTFHKLIKHRICLKEKQNNFM